MYHAFGNVALVHIRWYLLVFACPLVSDAVDVGGNGFIIKDVEVDRESACLHAFHDGVVRRDLVCIGLGFEGLNHDSVGANGMCQHDVAVATARFNWEAPHIVSEDGVHCSGVDVDFVRKWLFAGW